ncbi:pseudouridine synthase [Suillus subalutaceus]|uniref:pseudouridine synthase n=1 Tax=Suillus subalutaceus TaxID=48586 RepID=UPI001B864152|nr:pseudouridine synthase [Suillus subalutaceus]KAG1865893.1 pseudouridine synthase [Suillus subalutaceus]
MTPNYESWSKDELIARLREVETKKHAKSTHLPTSKKPFHFSSHPKRKIAIKFCYSGWEYNGLAYQNGPTPLPTVEDVLFKAFVKARLVDETGGLDGCGWEKCGRTDRGVSAAGQVVSLWDTPQNTSLQPSTKNELRYVSILNRVLPPTIRVLAWSPISPNFSARFNCKHRHYKYFFTSHGLDVSLMQSAANRLIGEHDFRNLCKLDPGKQITNFHRCIVRAQINLVSPESDGDNRVYVFDLVGSAFLYHQVRHIMAVLFLVGTGLEQPSIISTLMNVCHAESDSLPESQLPLVDRKPEYQMADALPLMLWDCAYADSDVTWQTDDDGTESGSGSDLYHQLHSIHQRSLIHTVLDEHFLTAATQYHSPPPQYFPFSQTGLTPHTLPRSNLGREPVLGAPLGAGTYKRSAKYTPLLERKRLDHVDVANERWRIGRGSKYSKQKTPDDGIE